MSFADPIAHAVVEIEPVVNQGAFQGAAQQAAENFNKAITNSFARGTGGIQTIVKNLQAGFTTLGQAIAARLPAGVTTAANAIASKLGSAFGAVQAGFSQLSAGGTAAFGAIGEGARDAAIAVVALTAIAIKVTKSFAETADAFQSAELGLNAVISASSTANITTAELTGSLRELGASLGISSVGLSRAAQQLIAVGVDGKQTERVLTAISKAGAATGATSAQIGRALDGLTQIASKGTLQMEELRRQIAGNIPGAINIGRVFEILAKQTGLSVAEVQKLQKAGQITAEQAIPAITQALEEGTQGIDVFALRAKSLSGLLGILRENFNQIVGTSFKSFIDALAPSLKGFIDQIKGGTGPFKNLTKDISTFGKIMGENLVKVLNEVVPLLPQIFSLFVKLTGVIVPIVVEVIKMGTSISRILLPVLNVLASVLDVVFNKLGFVSNILRIIAAGILVGGIVKGFELFGRALGSIGGLLGRVATPLSKLLNFLAELAPVIAKAVIAFGFLKGPIEAIIGLLGGAIDKLKEFSDFLSNLPGIKQFIGLIGGIAGAVGDAFGSDGATGEVSNFSEALLGAARTVVQTKDSAVDLFSKMKEGLESVLSDTDKLEKAQKAVTDAQDAHSEAIKKEATARENVTAALQRQTDAQQKFQEITDKLTDTEAKRQKLLEDTGADLREIADAQRDLEKIGFKLLDIDRDRVETLEKIKELSIGPTADEIAEADDRITRAKIALTKAQREEAEALNELNQDQQNSLDLAGLSLDDLRTRLAGLRSAAAAQRATKKETKSAEEIQEDITLAHLNTRDAQREVNDAVQDRADLDTVVIKNQTTIEGLTQHLKEIENDRNGLLDDQIEARIELDKLLSGETTHQTEIKKLDEDIKNLKIDQKNATADIQAATADIAVKEDAVKAATKDIRDKAREITIAKADQKVLTTDLFGTEQEINNALLNRIGLNGTLIGQSQELLEKNLLANPDVLQALLGKLQEAAGFGVKGLPTNAADIANLLLNNPNKLRELLRRFGGLPFEQGGLITHPTLATMGEKFKHEMVIPLTKPDRVWSLMSKTLPRYPGALAAAQKAISPPSISSLPKAVNLGSSPVISRDDGPATYGQLKELISILREQRTEVHVDAPITVNDNTGIPEHMYRKLSREVTRNVLDQIRRR